MKAKSLIAVEPLPDAFLVQLPTAFRLNEATASGLKPEPKSTTHASGLPKERRTPKMSQVLRHREPVEAGARIRRHDADLGLSGAVVGTIAKTTRMADGSFISVAVFYEPVDLREVRIEGADAGIALAAKRKRKDNIFDLTTDEAVEESEGLATATGDRPRRNLLDLTS